MLILWTNVGQKLLETEFSLAICLQSGNSGDKLQSKSLFLVIFDQRLSIVKIVFDCRLSCVILKGDSNIINKGLKMQSVAKLIKNK